jgi:DUF4097 and DUF4098 domain-containing protein YvlB
MSLRPVALVLPLALASCHIHAGRGHFTVDGVRLEAKHEEVLTLEEWPAGGLRIDSHQGDITVERGEGQTTLVVMVHERHLGDAHAHIEQGRLVARAADGSTCAIGNVRLRASGPLAGLVLDSGMGDVELHEVEVTGRLSAATGMGDVLVRAAGAPDEVELSSGMGDVFARNFRCRRLVASTGMGDVDIEGMHAEEAELSSGMGDVEVVQSSGNSLEADTGLGDVDLRESSFERRDLSTGLGSVDSR